MGNVTANLKGIQRLALQIAEAKVLEAKAVAVEIAREELETHTPGGYEDQFYSKPEGPTSASLGNTAQQTVILEGGTVPHRIPLRGYAHLRFKWVNPPRGLDYPADENGFSHFPFVNHPGTKAYRILQRALSRVIRYH